MQDSKKVLGILALMIAPLAQAGDDDLKWNGYLSLVGGILKDEPVSDTTSNEQVPAFLNYENRFTAMQDTLFALQASKRLAPNLSITGQLMARGSQEEFKNTVNWAYVTYELDDVSSFRFGRLGMPSYYYSDFIDVGTAYHWIRPPREVYSDPIFFQGVNYLRRDSFSSIDITTEAFGGAFDQTLKSADGTEVSGKGRDLVGLSFTAGYDGWLTTRLMYAQSTGTTTSSLDFSEQLDSYRSVVGDAMVDGALSDIGNVLSSTTLYKYYNGSIKADFDNWFFVTEGIIFNGDGAIRSRNRDWYASGGIRSGRFIYHLTFSRAEDNVSENSEELTNLLSQRIVRYIEDSAAADRKAVTLGVRVDTTRTTALKAEVTRFEEFASRESETAGIGKNTLLRVGFNASF